MPYSNVIDRSTDASALIPEDVSREIIEGVKQKSAVLELFRHRTMTRAQQRMPVKSLLPTAYWVSGDTGMKQTTEVNWANKYLDAAELAVIVPIPETLAADMDYSVWEEVKPDLEEAIAVALDNAVMFAIGKPVEWTNFLGLVPAAYAAANNVLVAGSGAPTDVATDINAIMAAVEVDGYVPNGFWAPMTFKSTLRNARDLNQGLLYHQDGPANTGLEKNRVSGELYSERIIFNNAGLAWQDIGNPTPKTVRAITGDWNQGIVGIRQDITYKMLDQAVLQDGAGNILYNLAQQDMVALRVTARYAAQIPNPINRANASGGVGPSTTRFPFSYLYV